MKIIKESKLIKEDFSLSDIKRWCYASLDTLLEEKFEEGLADTLHFEVNEYDPDWCIDYRSNDLKAATASYLDALIEDLFHYCNKEEESLEESLNNREKQVYIDAIKEVEDREDLEDIIHEIYFYDKNLFASLRHLPKDEPLDKSKDRCIGILSGSLDEDIEDINNMDQEFTSANTSINASKLPAIFNMVHFEPNTINLDYGGGKFDNAAEYLAQQDVTNLVYDPFNRTQQHNNEVINAIRKNGGADTVTCSNVLNVIKEPEVRLNVLQNIKKLVKNNGTVYITVYEGKKGAAEGPTKSGYQLNRPTEGYLEEIQQVFPDAKRKGKLIVAHPNRNESLDLDEKNMPARFGSELKTRDDIFNSEKSKRLEPNKEEK